jgi:hypothetical protein
MKIAVSHHYKVENDAYVDIIETDKLPDALKLQVEQAILVRLDKLELPVDTMQTVIYDAGGLSDFPMMIMGKLNLIAV